jgi:hypothetical protein
VTAPAAPTADLTLDACAALRADVAAQGAPPDAPTSAAADGAVDVAGPWLLLVTSLERAAQLPPKRRPAHFRRASAVWDDAAQVLGEPRYASVGVRLARWRTTDPTLPLVRELLWGHRAARGRGVRAPGTRRVRGARPLLPAADVRRGYVLAQSARALRTLGDLDSARERYEVSKALANKRRDSWLRVRSAIGLGATYHQSGNLPAARAVFTEISSGARRMRGSRRQHTKAAALRTRRAGPQLRAGARVVLLRASREGVFPRIDAWTLMASVCEGLGRYRAAAHMAEAVLRHATRPDDIAVSLQTLVATAAATCDSLGGVPMRARSGAQSVLERARTTTCARCLRSLNLSTPPAIRDGAVGFGARLWNGGRPGAARTGFPGGAVDCRMGIGNPVTARGQALPGTQRSRTCPGTQPGSFVR